MLDWVTYAKLLIKNRAFGVNQAQLDWNDHQTFQYQRFDHKGDFILYKDPDQKAQEAAIAKNLQLALCSSPKQDMRVEYLMPLLLKLNVLTLENLLGAKDGLSALRQSAIEDYDHLDGYLPDGADNSSLQTVASMEIASSKLGLIKETFGDKISRGDGCLLQCLHPIVQV